MNFLTRNKIIIGIALLLIALNLALLGTIGIRSIKPREKGPAEEPSPRKAHEMVTKQLKLTPEQQEQFGQLRKEHFENTRQVRHEIQSTHKAIAEELGEEEPNEMKLDSLTQRIGQLHILQQQGTIEHFMKLREVCSPEQRVHLKKMLRRMMNPALHERRIERANKQRNRGKSE